MIIDRETLDYQTQMGCPDTNFVAGALTEQLGDPSLSDGERAQLTAQRDRALAAYHVLDDGSALAAQVRAAFPYYRLETDEAGQVTGVVALPAPPDPEPEPSLAQQVAQLQAQLAASQALAEAQQAQLDALLGGGEISE